MDKAELLKSYLYEKISTLEDSMETLAKLRNGTNKDPMADHRLYPVILEGLPSELMGDGSGDPSDAEMVAYIALTLFGLHQYQSGGGDASRGYDSFGKAVSRLCEKGKTDIIKSKLDSVMMSETPEAFLRNAKGIVKLLKEKSISFSYPNFAHDTFLLLFPEDRKDRNDILLEWGEDFHQALHTKEA